MNMFNKIMWIIFQAIWGLPQTLLGLIMIGFYHSSYGIHGIKWDVDKKIFIVDIYDETDPYSLGLFVFISHDLITPFNHILLYHEYGHSIQSRILGPLYLLVIGLPSFTWANLRDRGYFKNRTYYSFYTERWADKLAGCIEGRRFKHIKSSQRSK